MFDLKSFLIDRNKCIIYQAEKFTNDSEGWIGGNIPEYFLSQDGFVEKYRNDYYFYLAFRNPFNHQNMYTILAPRDLRKLHEENIYPNCSIMLIEHELSKESIETVFTQYDIVKHSISQGKVNSNVENADEEVAHFLIRKRGSLPLKNLIP